MLGMFLFFVLAMSVVASQVKAEDQGDDCACGVDEEGVCLPCDEE